MNVHPQLLKDCKKGDQKAQYQLYRLCFDRLMGICVRYHSNREDALEALNNGFFKVLTGLSKYKEKVPFDAWVSRIMINTIIDDFRKNRKVKELIDYTDFAEDSWEEKRQYDLNEAEKNFDAEELEGYIQSLPAVSRKVFNLFAIDGYKHPEIAELLKISVGTSKWHLSFARKKLKEMLEKAAKATKVL